MLLHPQLYLDDPEVRDAVHGWLSDVVQRANGTSAHRQASFAHFLRQLQSPEFFGQVEPLELPGRGWMLLPPREVRVERETVLQSNNAEAQLTSGDCVLLGRPFLAEVRGTLVFARSRRRAHSKGDDEGRRPRVLGTPEGGRGVERLGRAALGAGVLQLESGEELTLDGEVVHVERDVLLFMLPMMKGVSPDPLLLSLGDEACTNVSEGAPEDAYRRQVAEWARRGAEGPAPRAPWRGAPMNSQDQHGYFVGKGGSVSVGTLLNVRAGKTPRLKWLPKQRMLCCRMELRRDPFLDEGDFLEVQAVRRPGETRLLKLVFQPRRKGDGDTEVPAAVLCRALGLGSPPALLAAMGVARDDECAPRVLRVLRGAFQRVPPTEDECARMACRSLGLRARSRAGAAREALGEWVRARLFRALGSHAWDAEAKLHTVLRLLRHVLLGHLEMLDLELEQSAGPEGRPSEEEALRQPADAATKSDPRFWQVRTEGDLLSMQVLHSFQDAWLSFGWALNSALSQGKRLSRREQAVSGEGPSSLLSTKARHAIRSFPHERCSDALLQLVSQGKGLRGLGPRREEDQMTLSLGTLEVPEGAAASSSSAWRANVTPGLSAWEDTSGCFGPPRLATSLGLACSLLEVKGTSQERLTEADREVHPLSMGLLARYTAEGAKMGLMQMLGPKALLSAPAPPDEVDALHAFARTLVCATAAVPVPLPEDAQALGAPVYLEELLVGHLRRGEDPQAAAARVERWLLEQRRRAAVAGNPFLRFACCSVEGRELHLRVSGGRLGRFVLTMAPEGEGGPAHPLLLSSRAGLRLGRTAGGVLQVKEAAAGETLQDLERAGMCVWLDARALAQRRVASGAQDLTHWGWSAEFAEMGEVLWRLHDLLVGGRHITYPRAVTAAKHVMSCHPARPVAKEPLSKKRAELDESDWPLVSTDGAWREGLADTGQGKSVLVGICMAPGQKTVEDSLVVSDTTGLCTRVEYDLCFVVSVTMLPLGANFAALFRRNGCSSVPLHDLAHLHPVMGLVREGTTMRPGMPLFKGVNRDSSRRGHILHEVLECAPGSEKTTGTVTRVTVAFKEDSVATWSVRVTVSRRSPLKVGDKVLGQAAQKTSISEVLPARDMPWNELFTLQALYQPHAFIARMSVGFLVEMLLGWVAVDGSRPARRNPRDGVQIPALSERELHEFLLLPPQHALSSEDYQGMLWGTGASLLRVLELDPCRPGPLPAEEGVVDGWLRPLVEGTRSWWTDVTACDLCQRACEELGGSGELAALLERSSRAGEGGMRVTVDAGRGPWEEEDAAVHALQEEQFRMSLRMSALFRRGHQGLMGDGALGMFRLRQGTDGRQLPGLYACGYITLRVAKQMVERSTYVTPRTRVHAMTRQAPQGRDRQGGFRRGWMEMTADVSRNSVHTQQYTTGVQADGQRRLVCGRCMLPGSLKARERGWDMCCLNCGTGQHVVECFHPHSLVVTQQLALGMYSAVTVDLKVERERDAERAQLRRDLPGGADLRVAVRGRGAGDA